MEQPLIQDLVYHGFQILNEEDSEIYILVLVVQMDEISMVFNIRLLHIHKRICEIFGCSDSQPFANLSILVVGDLLVATNKSPSNI